MKTTWLIQTSGFNHINIEEYFKALNKLQYSAFDFGLIQGSNEITNLYNIFEDTKNIHSTNYIVKGGIKVLKILDNISSISECSDLLSSEQIEQSNLIIEKLKSSIDYNVDAFDQNIYKNFNLPLLNHNSTYTMYNKIKDISFNSDMFIKPSRDLKAFNGGVLPKGTTIEEFVLNNNPMDYKDETIIINDLIKIYSEYRFFVIEDKVITGSMYRLNDRTEYSSVVPSYIQDAADEYCKLYKPSNIFCMDIADTPFGPKIIEYNCWNASGVYHSDIQKLFYNINEYKSTNQ